MTGAHSAGFGGPTLLAASSTQLLRSGIYLCVDGLPTSTLVDLGHIKALNLVQGNPYPPTRVAPGRYEVRAAAPPGYHFVSCGRPDVDIPTPVTASQTVIVPAGGSAEARFCVVPESRTATSAWPHP